ncbi:MAG: cadmium-translocating P-type ATPase [Bacilli bacterium]|nr:cadmium-translocating P-type ATPase [Bacilli bacterium]
MKKLINKDLLKIIISSLMLIITIFVKNNNLKLLLIIISYIIISYTMYIESFKNIKKGEIFDENFLMIIATIASFLIKNYIEAVLVILLFQIGEYFSHLAVHKSKDSITKLMDLRVETVNVEKDKKIENIPIEKVNINDIFIVKPGEKIPLDGILIEGETYLDTVSITGESVLKKVRKDDSVISGCINKTSIIKVKAISTYKTTTTKKIIDLIENSNKNKSNTENFIRKFAKIYTPIIVLVATLLVIVPSCMGKDLTIWLYRAIVFLVTSCPCALVISVPLGYFCGIGLSSKEGILIKGSKELEQLNDIDYLILDKTGTITEGVFEVTKIKTKLKENEFLNIIASVEENSIHPIARAIKKENKDKLKTVKNYQELAGLGISCKIDNKFVLLGNYKLLEKNNIKYPKEKDLGTIIYLAIDNIYQGHVIISDKIKESSLNIKELKKFIKKDFIILSGDNEEIVKEVANKVGINLFHGNLLPLDKVKYIKKYQQKGKVMFVGDGINDAPVLKISDIGISMGNIGTDAAIEASDIVLMNDNLLTIATAIKIAKKTKRKVVESIILALSVKFIVLVLGLFGMSTIYMAVFADVGVTFLVILNVLTIFYKKL